jgi:hypothetical protein
VIKKRRIEYFAAAVLQNLPFIWVPQAGKCMSGLPRLRVFTTVGYRVLSPIPGIGTA